MQSVKEKWMNSKRATQLEVDADGWRHVRYHATRVVSWRENLNGSVDVILDSGGWRTVTTKQRMNEVSAKYGFGFVVSSLRGAWFVWLREENKNISFKDGMKFTVTKEETPKP